MLNMLMRFRPRKQGPTLASHVRTMYCANMATNLDVDITAIEELMAIGDFRSKREAVDAAVREALAWRRQLKSREFLATIDFRPVLLEPTEPGPEA